MLIDAKTATALRLKTAGSWRSDTMRMSMTSAIASTTTRAHQTTAILRDLQSGDDSAAQRLLPLVYTELHKLASAYFRGQRADHTPQPTALVHEAYLKLVDQAAADFNDRAHFLAVAARAMRQSLIDHARGRSTSKRGGSHHRVVIDDPCAPDALCRLDVLALDEALTDLERKTRKFAPEQQVFFARDGLAIEV